ncbi:MAG: hypothetical protein P8186_24115, partial [Anaerolineae bacterium]
MKQDVKKMTLSAQAVAEAQKAHTAAAEEFLDPQKPRANVVGMGVGVKWKKGEPTGEPALVVLVTQKLDKDQLSEAEMVPP